MFLSLAPFKFILFLLLFEVFIREGALSPTLILKITDRRDILQGCSSKHGWDGCQ
jgi:hypothetical protein